MFKKIDEVSKLSGVSKRTLQYYDDEGILPVKRSKNNYRLYDDETMERLWKDYGKYYGIKKWDLI